MNLFTVSTRASLALFALVCAPAARAQETAVTAPAPPVELTAQEDHQRTMQLLGMSSIRQGANGNNPEAPNAANYDETKANPYPHLPDPLLLMNREWVTTPEMWWEQRRPEIVELFDREVYGRVPENIPAVTWEVVSASEEMNGDVPIVTKQLVGHVDNSSYPHVSVDIQVSLSTPANARGPVPVILRFGGGGSGPPRPAGAAAPAASGAQGAGAPGAPVAAGGGQGARPPQAQGRQQGGRPGGGPQGPSWSAQILERGWGYATINTGSVQRDNGAGLTTGIIGLMNRGQPRELDDWGALRAWAWGASRSLDHFASDPAVDATKVGLEGHSRWGKATLVAMAYDPRFAVAYVSSSGAGGAKLHRRNAGEIVENVAGSGEYHWMAGNYVKYAGMLSWDDLPVDSHQLIAMAAPRPVFISSGERGDGWVDARGMFMAAAAAQPVYALLGARTMGTNEFPAVETGLMDGEISFRQHSGGHTDGPNWPTFLDFAARYLEPEARTPSR
jgi:hypothetical protein